MSLIIAGKLAQLQLEAEQRALASIAADDSLDLPHLIEMVLQYHGAIHPEPIKQISDRITSLAHARGMHLREGEALQPNLVLGNELLKWAGPTKHTYLTPQGLAGLDKHELLAPRANIHKSDELSDEILRSLNATMCPEFCCYRVPQSWVYLHPHGFQVFDKDELTYIAAASSRPFTTSIFELDYIRIDQPVILVQDVFHGVNFSHFLLDWMARANFFLAQRNLDKNNCVLLFGGIPNAFHQLVVRGLCRAFGISEDNIFFPTGPTVCYCASSVTFFSDTVDVAAHPAQMCRPEAIGHLKRLAAYLPIERTAGSKRIYISRGDVGRRMLQNERAAFNLLEPFGFEFVRLGDRTVADQIRIISSAECVVGAHGMGLTHLAFHPGKPRVVELFNPKVGTATYAFLAKGLGFEYVPIVGETVGQTEDFTIDLRDLTAAIAGLAPRQRKSTGAAFDRVLIVPGRGWSAGVQREQASLVEMAPPVRGAATIRHLRTPLQTKDTNVGWWSVPSLVAGEIYTFSCHVFIPRGFRGTRVTLEIGDWAAIDADVSSQDRWQRLVVARTCPIQEPVTEIVLRMDTDYEEHLFSSAWAIRASPFD